jgi:hypothetical protein
MPDFGQQVSCWTDDELKPELEFGKLGIFARMHRAGVVSGS